MNQTWDNFTTREGARSLRLAVITNLWKRGLLSDQEARDLLNAPLNPHSTDVVDDSKLLGDPEGLEKIKDHNESKQV